MKKIWLLILFIIIFLLSGQIGEAKVIIPEEAIRLRVIPNSNSKYDQEIKIKVKKDLQNNIVNLVSEADNVKEARRIIKNNLFKIDKEVNNLLEKEQYFLGYKINYGYNYFPEKQFSGVKYNKGNYESLVITLGEGQGDNWWCVMFPPLCLMEASESNKIEYTTYVGEIIKKYQKRF